MCQGHGSEQNKVCPPVLVEEDIDEETVKYAGIIYRQIKSVMSV